MESKKWWEGIAKWWLQGFEEEWWAWERRYLDEIRQEERQNLEVMKQKSKEPIAPLAFAEENWAGNAFKGHLDAASFSRWGDGGVVCSNSKSLFPLHCTISVPTRQCGTRGREGEEVSSLEMSLSGVPQASSFQFLWHSSILCVFAHITISSANNA